MEGITVIEWSVRVGLGHMLAADFGWRRRHLSRPVEPIFLIYLRALIGRLKPC
jgi:hypothetical protein